VTAIPVVSLLAGSCLSRSHLWTEWAAVQGSRASITSAPGPRVHLHVSHLRSVPRHNLSFVSRAFRISAPEIRNFLPPHILQSQTLSSFLFSASEFGLSEVPRNMALYKFTYLLTYFRRHLKTHYFQSAYSTPYSAHPQCALILLWDFGTT